jgi:hypothetical protein
MAMWSSRNLAKLLCMTSGLGCGSAATCPTGNACDDAASRPSMIFGVQNDDDSKTPAVVSPSPAIDDVRCPALADPIVRDEATLEQVRGCSVVEGNLGLFGLEGLDLSPLTSLRHVEGELTLTEFNRLEALADLRTARSLSLQRLAVPSLRPLSGLVASAESESGLHIHECDNLSDLVGLDGFRVSNLVVSNNAKLRTLQGISVRPEMRDVGIHENPTLGSLWADSGSSLLSEEAYVRRARFVGVSGNPALRDLTPIALLQATQELRLSELPGLPVFPELTEVSILEVQHNRVPPNGANVGEVSIVPALEQIQPGANSGLLLIDNRGMTKFRLPSLSATTTIWIRDNADLVSVEVPGLRSISDWLIATCNPQLSEAAFDDVRHLVATERLVLEGNFGSDVPCDGI